jgi:hypothetical protein
MYIIHSIGLLVGTSTTLSVDSMISSLVRFQNSNSLLARKLIKEIRFPEINGKVCRALPYDRDTRNKLDMMKGSLFVKGLGKGWTHK